MGEATPGAEAGAAQQKDQCASRPEAACPVPRSFCRCKNLRVVRELGGAGTQGVTKAK